MTRIIYLIGMLMSKKYLVKKYGKEFWRKFKNSSKFNFNRIIKETPKIGNSIFSLNYKYAPAYISWFKAFSELGIQNNEIDENIWKINEEMMSMYPKFILKAFGKAYFNSFRRKASSHIEKQNQGVLHPYDWKIQYKDINSNTFEIHIIECAFVKLAKDFDVPNLLPGICRIDYLMANLLGNGFERTKTLGDGDDCCNCRYHIIGNCEWSPEKGFEVRK